MSKLIVAGIEVVQTIQNPKNEVQLISGKRTFVRIYLSQQTDDEAIVTQVRGQLRIESHDGSRTFEPLTSSNAVQFLGPDHPSVDAQRLHWSGSLNFELPRDVTQGTIKLSVESLINLRSGKELPVSRDEALSAEYPFRVVFREAPEMRCRMLVFRYFDDESGGSVEPIPQEVDLILDFVRTTFPVAEITSTKLTVEAASAFQQIVALDQPTDRGEERIERALSRLFCQILALRNQDIYGDGKAGEDLCTMYLGVLADPAGEFGGAAMDSPLAPAPHTVAVASVDTTGQIGAHELGHVLGRGHPGFPPLERHGREIGQRVEDSGYPFELGLISGRRRYEATHSKERVERHLGLDTRRGISPPEVLHSDQWFDLMTYRHPTWISHYTYEGIYERLMEQQRMKEQFSVREQGYSLTVIGEFDLDRVTGRIAYVLPTRYRVPTPAVVGDDFPISINYVTDKGGSAKKRVYVRSPNAIGLTPTFGLFQYTVEADEPLSSVQLFVGEVEVDRYEEGEAAVTEAFEGVVEAVAESQRQIPLEAYKEAVFRPLHADDEEQSKGELPQVPDADNGTELVYDIESDSYRFAFRWPPTKCRRTTTIQCKRPSSSNEDAPWETVAVTNSHAKHVWISPEFFNPAERAAQSGLPANVSIAAREERPLYLRIRVTVGFQTREILVDSIRPKILGPKRAA